MATKATVPWLPDLGPEREVPGKAFALTQIATLICQAWPPLPYRGRVNLVFFRTGLDYDLCRHAVWLALELGMLEWVDEA